MGLPPIPWHIRKQLLRELMRDVLPDEILARPKTALVADPISILLEREGRGDLASLKPALENYVAVDAVPRETSGSPGSIWVSMVPMSLGLWLTRSGNLAKHRAQSQFFASI